MATLTKEQKKLFLELIKDVKLDQQVIGNEQKRKWYEFGAYDALRILAANVSEYEEKPSGERKAVQ